MTTRRLTLLLTLLSLLFTLVFYCSFFSLPKGLEGDVILYQLRIPAVVTAIFSGSTLSASGLASQSYFQNPLATQDVLGIGAASSLGAIVYLFVSFIHPLPFFINIFSSAFFASFLFSLILISLSRFIQSILIFGILSSFFFFSLSSVLLQLSNQQIVKMHLLWGLGSFNANSLSQTPLIVLCALILLISFFLFSKPLNLLILGRDKAFYEGVSLPKVQIVFLFLISLSVSLNVVWAGPIAFISLVAPHLARILFQEQNHYVLFPLSALVGSIFSLAALFLSKILAAHFIELSINPLLSFLSFPILVYFLLTKKFKTHGLY